MRLVAAAPHPAPPVDADEAVTSLYAAQWTTMVRLAWLFVHDPGLAEEIAQDAFVAVHRRWSLLRDVDRAGGYLRQCVVNGARSALRHDKVVRRVDQVTAGDTQRLIAGSAEQQVVARERHTELVEVLGTLPQRQREVLTLRYFLDLDEAAIADALGISRGAVKSHAHRGLAALRTATAGRDLG